MRLWPLLSLALATALAPTTAHAACTVSADKEASARRFDPAISDDARLIVSMSFVPKVMHLTYEAAAHRPDCDLGPLMANDAAYELWGDDHGGRQRKALPSRKGLPIALVVAIFDITEALDGAKTGTPAKTKGYMLATITKDRLTGFRFYTAMPAITVLKRDMAEALAGTIPPIFSNDAAGKTALFVPKG